MPEDLEGALQRGHGKLLLPEPPPVALGPMAAAAEHAAMAREQLEHAMTPTEHVAPDVVPAAEQVAPGLLHFRRHVDRGQFPRAEQAHQLDRVPPIRLDALAGPARRQGRGHHLAGHVERAELAIQIIEHTGCRPPDVTAVVRHRQIVAMATIEMVAATLMVSGV